MTIEVQQVSEAHKEGWLAMWQGYLTFYKEDLPAEQTELTWQRLLDPAFNMHGFVAIHDGLVVGLTNYSWTNSSWDAAPNIYLEDLFVDENLRGGGIGRSLIDAVTHVAHAKGSKRVRWITHNTNATARRLYDQLTEVSEYVMYDRDVPGAIEGQPEN
jgi:GNAT superfamily N-acetyltransferase